MGSYKNLRLIRKGSGKWRRRVHQFFEIQGETGIFKNPLNHYPHQSVSRFIESIGRWSTWHALANKEEGKRSSVLKIILFPVIHFTRNYFLRLGFLDGIQGFVFASLMSFHSFLSWSKLWLMQKSFLKN